MNTNEIVAALDAEIARLQQIRVLLVSSSVSKRRGRRPPASAASFSHLKRRTISAAGRKRIGDAQRKRWAKQKQAKA